MKTTLSTTQAAQMLADDENSSFSIAGAFALVEYLEQMEDDCGEAIEFDAVAIRCDYSEYESLQDWAHDYFSNAWQELGFNEEEEIDDDAFDSAIRDYIQDRGQLIEFEGGIIVSSF
jgi:hypothetical protein